jgi:molybdate transport system ATP-binding protein
LLLLDEPLASLDPRARMQLIRILLRIKSEFGVPMIYVSHRWDEIVRLADTVLWLESGLLKRYEPLSQLAADFELAKYHPEDAACVLIGRASQVDETQQLTELTIGQQSMWIPDTTLSINTDHRLLIRVQDVSLSLSEHPNSSILNHLRCAIEGIDLNGSRALIRLNCEGQSFLAQITRNSCESLNLEPGKTLLAHIKASVLS